METALQLIHLLAGFIVLAEAMNKMERTQPNAPVLTRLERFVEWLKAIAWLLLGLGAAGALATPLLLSMGLHSGTSVLLRLERPTLAETCVLLGFAVLIIRTRFKEG
jgi:uncharacterized short protein YbdD (DUF466 family)